MLSQIIRKLKNLNFYTWLFIVVFIIAAFFGYYKIGSASINNDAHFWYTRTQDFWWGIQHGKLNRTYQDAKPGVTVMWLSGLSLEAFLNLYETVFKFRPEIYTHATFYLVHFSVIAPLVTVHLLSILMFYIVFSKLFSREAALYGVILFAFQPFVAGLVRNFHADSTVTSFMLMSSITAIYYLEKTRKTKYILLSGIFGGFALLSKSAAIYLIPYIGFLLLIDLLFNYKPKFSFKAFLPYAKIYLIWILSLAATFFVSFPAMWLKPIEILRRIFIYEGWFLVTEGRGGVNGFLYYAEPISRILTPLFLLSFFIGTSVIVVNFKGYSHTKKKRILYVVGFVAFYLLQMSLVKQKMDRYLLPMLPFVAFVGGVGLEYLNTLIKSPIVKKAFALLILALNLSFILYFFPNYLLYPSEPGKDQFGCSLCSDIGDYFNAKPNGADLKIATTSKKVHRLRPFVNGKVYHVDEALPEGWSIEYVVAATQEQLPEKYSYCVLETSIGFRGTEYWNIYSCK
ncbi:MAG: ArnT family glycosyltransferase [Patescibacteria group bacterium]